MTTSEPVLTMRDVVWRLERIAGNCDTDPRWIAAAAIRALEGWETFQVHPGAAPPVAIAHEAVDLLRGMADEVDAVYKAAARGDLNLDVSIGQFARLRTVRAFLEKESK